MYSEESKKKFYYLLSDIVALVLTYIALSHFYDYRFFDSKFFAVLFLCIIVTIGIFTDEYSAIEDRGYLKEGRVAFVYGFKVVFSFAFVLLLGKIRYLEDIGNMSYFFLLAIFLLSTSLVYIGRMFLKEFLLKRVVAAKKVLLMTNFKDVDTLKENLVQEHYEVVGYISKEQSTDGLPVLHTVEELRQFIALNFVEEIIVNNDAYDKYSQMFKDIKLLGVPTTVAIANYNNYYIGESTVKKIGNQAFLTSAIMIAKVRQLILKRLMDIVVASVGVIIMLIAAIIVAPIVKIQSPGPLFFKQKRVGKNGKIFEMYKFRSMYLDAEERKKELLAQNELDTNLMFKMKNDPRIFPFGKKLRDWSIDELPQFINVLKGDMSVVGTRPPTVEEYKNYELHHFKRLGVKPGITGLWQVSGRSDISDFEEVVALDTKYIQNWSIGEDIKIIAKTFAVVLKKEGSR